LKKVVEIVEPKLLVRFAIECAHAKWNKNALH
jgi:hypothetical protein